MAGPKQLKVYPTPEECQIKNNLTCPMEDCSQTFTSESNLNLHLCKTHRAGELKRDPVERWYYCPGSKCPWNSVKHFKKLKLLRQHYTKVHLEKGHICSSCKKPFLTVAQLSRHSHYCGVHFNCLDCTASYPCYETLKTHCRRKSHKLLSKGEYKTGRKSMEGCDLSVNVSSLLLPKKIIKCETEAKARKTNMVSQETQTDPITPQKQDGPEENNCNFKSMNTQTDAVESRETSCNTSFNFEDFEFTFIEKNSLGTQTQQNLLNNSENLLSDTLSNFDTTFFSCTETKTQTDMIFDNEIFGSDYYSDMYTQTCDEILSSLSDIQTQTVFQDTLRSVESQTMMSSADQHCSSIFKEIVHTETQTDTEFRQMLEIINS